MTTTALAEEEDAQAPTARRDAAAETAVPDGTDAVECDRCGRPFPDADLLALHRGLAHHDDLSDEERDAYESAYTDESAALRIFRLQAIAALVVLYFGFLFAYAIVG